MPRGGHAERAMQGSWRQEYGAAHAGGPRTQQAGKLETRALFAGSQGGTVAPPSGNTCAPRPVRLDLKAPVVPRPDTDHTGPSISPASMPMARSRGLPLCRPFRALRSSLGVEVRPIRVGDADEFDRPDLLRSRYDRAVPARRRLQKPVHYWRWR